MCAVMPTPPARRLCQIAYIARSRTFGPPAGPSLGRRWRTVTSTSGLFGEDSELALSRRHVLELSSRTWRRDSASSLSSPNRPDVDVTVRHLRPRLGPAGGPNVRDRAMYAIWHNLRAGGVGMTAHICATLKATSYCPGLPEWATLGPQMSSPI